MHIFLELGHIYIYMAVNFHDQCLIYILINSPGRYLVKKNHYFKSAVRIIFLKLII